MPEPLSPTTKMVPIYLVRVASSEYYLHEILCSLTCAGKVNLLRFEA